MVTTAKVLIIAREDGQFVLDALAHALMYFVRSEEADAHLNLKRSDPAPLTSLIAEAHTRLTQIVNPIDAELPCEHDQGIYDEHECRCSCACCRTNDDVTHAEAS